MPRSPLKSARNLFTDPLAATLRFVLPLSLLLLTLSACSSPSMATRPDTPADRSFHIRYEAKLTDLPVGEPLELWIPIPHDDTHQAITDVTITPSVEGYALHTTTEPHFGNRMVHLEGQVIAPELTVRIEYDVARWKITSDLTQLSEDGPVDGPALSSYRKPSKLGRITDEIRTISAKIDSQQSTLVRARAFYDHVAKEMAYDKSGQGWGRGDTVHACEIGKGNCTDYHSYFIALCQSQQIPARFQIGLYGSYDVKTGEEYETGGYHCWAEFHVPGQRWVPVDISEGDKNPAKGDYFFGNHSANRVTLSMGRDLILSPPQQGEPVNFFIYPYAEVSGESFPTSKASFWRDH